MIDEIKALSLADKKNLLAMLQASLGDKIEEVVAPKLTPEQVEARNCNKIAELKRAGCNTVCLMVEFDVVIKRKPKIATVR
jgi:hypothetical protein